MTKKIVAAAAALLIVVAAGVFWGPGLYSRLFHPATPLGRLTGVRAIEQFPENGGFQPSRAVEGYQLWLVEFKPASGERTPAAGEAAKPGLDRAIARVKLIDDRGEPHGASIFQESSSGTPSVVTQRAAVFSIPRERQPRSVSVDGTAVSVRRR